MRRKKYQRSDQNNPEMEWRNFRAGEKEVAQPVVAKKRKRLLKKRAFESIMPNLVERIKLYTLQRMSEEMSQKKREKYIATRVTKRIRRKKCNVNSNVSQAESTKHLLRRESAGFYK
ncbi:hypothetical protein ACJMK2_028225 [Sinanodonta woodiana]|uniref:Uncharacterized protein n=1 Tax=Sinanodonta woodiana TaxID=1069815 RepID=A0ABD3XAD8_SINWO